MRPSPRQAGARPAVRSSPRRGMAVLMVVLLLSITLGLSYAMVRVQNTAMHVERNMDRREAARHAAMTGLTLAIKKMHTTAWGGVGSSLSGSLSASETYTATYSTGDALLTSAGSDWSDYPYRVTIDATGKAADPLDSSRVSSHKMRAVVRLVPRALAANANPAAWADAVPHTLYQHSSGSFRVSVPFRATGSVRCSARMYVARDYSWSDTIRARYLTDLELMRIAGGGDHRPFGGTILLPYSYQEAGLVSLLSSAASASPAGMGLTTENASVLAYNTMYGTSADTYRLYTGGQSYTAATLPQDCHDITLAPDPATNPLGIFVRYGTVDLNNNASIQGTVIARRSGNGDVHVHGQKVSLLAHSLPAVYGETQAVRLPTVVTQDDFRVCEGAQGLLQGLLNIGDEFEIVEDGQSGINLTMQLRVIAQDFLLRQRHEWDALPWWWWDFCYNEFTNQGSNPIAYFPVWLAKYTGLNYAPRLVIDPETTAYRYHWCNAQDGLYVAHVDDGGLRWEVVRWIDNP